MPKRKKLPDLPEIEGLGNDPGRNIVQKTNPLISLTRTSMTLSEFKILDVYLSRIDSHSPKKRTVRIERGDLEKCLGVTKINVDDLRKRLHNLFQAIDIKDPRRQNGGKTISLFDEATYYQDTNGQWTIDLTAGASAMEYIFNPESIGYLRYRLGAVIKLKSRYSYALFLYLEQQRHMHLVWEVSIDELKDVLNCHKDTYASYKRFSDLILKPSLAEVTSKTQCKAAVTPLRTGRNVTSLRFMLQPNEAKEDDNQITIWSVDEATTYEQYDAATEKTFTEGQLEQIAAALKEVPIFCLPSGESDNIRRYKLLSALYQRLKKREETVKINDRCAYLIRTLSNAKPVVGEKAKRSDAQSFDADEFMEAALKKSYGGKDDNT